jgi:hypothetical protein
VCVIAKHGDEKLAYQKNLNHQNITTEAPFVDISLPPTSIYLCVCHIYLLRFVASVFWWKYVEVTKHLIVISQSKALVLSKKHDMINPRKLHLNTEGVDIAISSKM